MSKTETKSDYLETLKSNYRQRIQEADNFSKRFSDNSSEFRSQVLTAILEFSQYYIDLQKKFMSAYPKWYDDNLMSKNSKTITEIWVQTIRNMDSFYSQFLDYASQNLRAANRVGMQVLQSYERYHDTFEEMPRLERNALVELIKEAKRYNDKYAKDNLEKRMPQNHKAKSKKETLTRDALVKTDS